MLTCLALRCEILDASLSPITLARAPRPVYVPDMTGNPDPDPAELEQLAEDWITLWQSEIAAFAADREAAEAWAAATAAWAALGAAWLRAAAAPPFGRPAPSWPHDGAVSTTRPPPSPSPPDAGGGPRDARPDDGLRDRLAELERRLADLEGGAGGARPDPRPPRRRKPRA
jgi:hypothetical protein